MSLRLQKKNFEPRCLTYPLCSTWKRTFDDICEEEGESLT